MTKMQLHAKWGGLLFCFLLVQAGGHCFAAGKDNVFQLSSKPNGANVYHYLRGNKHFLGITPFKVSKTDLAGKDSTRLLLNKFGFKQELFDIDVDGKKKTYTLKRQPPPYLQHESNSKLTHDACKARVANKIEKLIKISPRGMAGVQLPIRWVEQGNNTKIVVLAEVLNHTDVRKIKRMTRRDKDKAVELVEKLLSSTSKILLEQFKQQKCLNTVLLVGTYQDKGLTMDLTPYREHWTGKTEYTIGTTKYTRYAFGATVELQKDMVVTKKTKSFLFQYKLH